MSTSGKELQAFRAEVAAWMKANNPADPGFLLPQTFMEVGDEQQLEFLREWQHKVWAAGYLGMAWPKQYGGGGVDPIFQSIADQEMRRAGVPMRRYGRVEEIAATVAFLASEGAGYITGQNIRVDGGLMRSV